MSETYYDEIERLRAQIRALQEAFKPFLESDVIKYGALSRGRAQEYQAAIARARTVLQETAL